MNSSVDEATYKTQPSDYVPEALLNLWSTSSSNEPPAFHKLLTDPRTGRDDVTVTLLQPDGDFNAQEAADVYCGMEDWVKRFCETEGGDKPQISRYVLPCGEGAGSTTALHTRVRYGQVVQLLVEYYTEDELKKNAFTVHSAPRTHCLYAHARRAHSLCTDALHSHPARVSQFVQLMRNYADEGTELRSMNENEKKGLVEAWHVYLNVKGGPIKRAGLPRISELYRLNVEQLEASWQDIVVVQAMKELIRSPMHVFLGTGQSLHLDRIMVHDRIKKMNDKEQLDRYAVKSVETYALPLLVPRRLVARVPPQPVPCRHQCPAVACAHRSFLLFAGTRYQPAGVLENGNEFLDLPGLNDVDTGCTAQTREGIKEAGVIFVVLSKSLYEDENSLQMLRDSDTIKRAAAGEANVVFLFNREPLTTFRHRQL